MTELTIEQKIEQYIQLKNKYREIEKAMKSIEVEIKDSVKDPVEFMNHKLIRSERVSYTIKKDVDLEAIQKRYPGACTTKINIDTAKVDAEFIKAQFPEAYSETVDIKAKDLYQVAENPEEIVTVKTSASLVLKENKAKKEDTKAEDLDF